MSVIADLANIKRQNSGPHESQPEVNDTRADDRAIRQSGYRAPRLQFGMRRHPLQPDFDAVACNLIALAIRGNIQPGSQVWLTTYYVDRDGNNLLTEKHDLLSGFRMAQPWLTARELLDRATSFRAYWIPNTHCVPLSG